MNKDSREYIVCCTCGDKSDHVIHFAQYDLTDDFSDANMGVCVISTRLDPYRPWYKRLWVGIKYICGYDQYQYIDTHVDVQVLKEVLSKMEDNRTEEQIEKASEEHSRNIQVL